MSQLFNHARLILADRVIERGALETVNGVITAIHEQPLPEGCGMDLGGDDLIPGLVEIHTDNLEKHLMPRNGVLWPMLPAVITHDAQCVAAGITTVLDALSVGDLEGESVRLETLHTAFAAINLAMPFVIINFALADLIGLDTMLSVMEVFYTGFNDPKYRPAPLLKEMVDAGYLGRKSGQGFYSY